MQFFDVMLMLGSLSKGSIGISLEPRYEGVCYCVISWQLQNSSLMKLLVNFIVKRVLT
jgi:hypothetical protein